MAFLTGFRRVRDQLASQNSYEEVLQHKRAILNILLDVPHVVHNLTIEAHPLSGVYILALD